LRQAVLVFGIRDLKFLDRPLDRALCVRRKAPAGGDLMRVSPSVFFEDFFDITLEGYESKRTKKFRPA
jgi:hypothetical protein